ncbi:hypothetical protein B0H11DRAFT_1655154, partial [Mycena galericulata]
SYWTPLVDTFLTLWEDGIKFSQTHDYECGLVVRCAIVAVICDLPASRKIGGFSSHSHRRFCTHCGVGLNDFNTDRWQRRTAAECRTWMEKYKTAVTDAEAQRYFDQSGLRWTKFLRLPYFDVSRMIVVDCMHNLFLGLLREHFRAILGFRASTANPPPPPAIAIFIPEDQNNPLPTQGKNDEKSVTRTLKILRNRMVEDSVETMHKGLTKCTKPALLYVVKGSDMEALWNDIACVVKPSWMTSLPAQVGGSAGGGKLKADQGRVLATVYMPLTLVRLWFDTDPSNEQRQILDLTMDLVSAVILAASRETSASIAQSYHQHMLNYRARLRKNFPAYECHPNHHMALHITECLLLFGPVHGWWTFPFERLIGTLERILTNYRPG